MQLGIAQSDLSELPPLLFNSSYTLDVETPHAGAGDSDGRLCISDTLLASKGFFPRKRRRFK